MLTSHFYTGEWTLVILEACDFAKNDPETLNVVSHDISLIAINFGQLIPYYVKVRFDNGPDISSVLARFLGQFGCCTKQDSSQKYSVLCMRDVCKDFYGNIKF